MTLKFKPPLNEAVLLENEFFKLYPFDGGGAFINNEIVGDVDEATYVKRLFNGALKQFGGIENLDFKSFGYWRTIEKKCWLNRLYFLAPLARQYWISGDESLAIATINVIKRFKEQNPAPRINELPQLHEYIKEITAKKSKLITVELLQKDNTKIDISWYNFQPAMRLIIFTYVGYFLQNSRHFTERVAKLIQNLIEEHTQIIAIDERDYSHLHYGNHQALTGLSLLYAAAFTGSDLYRQLGIKIIDFHIKNDFFKDGVLREISPSYHVFELWIIRDAWLLAEKNAYKLCPETKNTLCRAIKFIENIRQPDGKLPVFNDGYAVNIDSFLKSFPEELYSSRKSNKKINYPDAGITIYRNRETFLCLDASSYITELEWHYHSGKNAVTLFYQNKPFIVDSGCCSYDDIEFAYYKDAPAHSTLLVNGEGDGNSTGLCSWTNGAVIHSTDWLDNSIQFTLRSKVNAWKDVRWQRKIELIDGILIEDTVTADSEKNYTFIFNLHPDVKVDKNNGNILLRNLNVQVILVAKSKDEFICRIKRGQCFIDGVHRQNSQLLFETKNVNCCMKFKFLNID